MMRFLVFLCTYLLIALSAEANPVAFFEGSWAELQKAAKNQNKPFFAYIYTDWCEPCQVMSEQVLQDAALSGFINHHFLPYQVEGEGRQGEELRSRYNIAYYPAFLFFDTQGQYLGKYEGYQSAGNFFNTLYRYVPEHAAGGGIAFFEGTWDELLREAKRTGKPFFIDFYTDWSGASRITERVVWQDATVGKLVKDNFLAARINTEQGEGIALAKKFKITTFPAFAFFDAQGKSLGITTGFHEVNEFTALLQSYLTMIKRADNPGIEFFKGTWQELLDEAKRTGKPFFVDFYTDWCGPCKMMDKQTFKNADVGEYAEQHFLAYKINAEKGEGIALANKYNVNAYPSIYFFNAEGKRIGKEVGFQDANRFLYTMEKYVKKLSKGRQSPK